MRLGLKKKFYTYHLVLAQFIISALLSMPVFADNLIDATQTQKNAGSNSPAINPLVEMSTATVPYSLEQAETTTLVTNQTEMSHQSEIPRSPNNAQTTEGQTNPYEQLVKLAFRGKGTDGVNSYEDAASLYCKKSKEENDANAQFALGWMYANGRGLAKDENIAALLFNKAAEQGHSTAKKWLVGFKGDAKLATVPSCMLSPLPPSGTPEIDIASDQANDREPFYTKGPIYNIVESLAPTYGIETDLVMAFIKIESGFNPKATSPKNAQGLMQLIPATAARFNVRKPYDPKDNIKGGLAYLQWLLAYFEGDVRLVAAAYNAGENAVDRYKGIPPYPETRAYVKKIYNLYRKSFHPYRQDLLVGEKSGIIRVSSNP